MKAKIGELEVEGTPDEIAVLARLIEKKSPTISKPTAEKVLKTYHKRWVPMPDSIKEGRRQETPPVQKLAPKILYKKVFKGMPVRILADMFIEDPSLMGLPEREIGYAYLKRTGIAQYNVSRFSKNVRKAMRLARKKERTLPSDKPVQYKRIELRGKKPYSVQKIADLLRKDAGLVQKPIREIYSAYIGHAASPGNHFKGNLEKAIRLLNAQSPAVKKGLIVSNHARVKKGFAVQKLVDMFEQNPSLADKPLGELYRLYLGHEGNYSGHFKRNVQAAIGKFKVSHPWIKENGSQPEHKVGRPATIRLRLLEMFKKDPSLADKAAHELSKIYYRNSNTRGGRAFYKHVKDAAAEFKADNRQKATNGRKVSEDTFNRRVAFTPLPSGTEERGIVRSFEYGYIRRGLMDELIRKMPSTFSMRDILRLAASRLGISPTDMRWRLLNKSIHSALSKRRDVARVQRATQKGHHGVINIYEKRPNTFVQAKPVETINSLFKAPPVAAETESKFVPLAEAQPFNPMIISKGTLDMIIENHMSFGADVFIGLRSKTGVTLAENDAIFAFRNLVDNISGLAAAYPHKHFRISGSGRWKAIEMY